MAFHFLKQKLWKLSDQFQRFHRNVAGISVEKKKSFMLAAIFKKNETSLTTKYREDHSWWHSHYYNNLQALVPLTGFNRENKQKLDFAKARTAAQRLVPHSKRCCCDEEDPECDSTAAPSCTWCSPLL